jgi:hypothetical protein
LNEPGVVAVPALNNGDFVAPQAKPHISARISPHFAMKLPDFRHFSRASESG